MGTMRHGVMGIRIGNGTRHAPCVASSFNFLHLVWPVQQSLLGQVEKKTLQDPPAAPPPLENLCVASSFNFLHLVWPVQQSLLGQVEKKTSRIHQQRPASPPSKTCDTVTSLRGGGGKRSPINKCKGASFNNQRQLAYVFTSMCHWESNSCNDGCNRDI